MPFIKVQTYIPNQQQKNRFRKGVLKTKNILFQNQQIQIGSKITPIYDFYTSQHFIQLQIFIGNKTNYPLDTFNLQYRATSNITLWLQQKDRFIKQKTQYKQRIIAGCNNFQQQILLLLNFSSQSLTIKNSPIPLTLWNFCVFNPTPAINDSKIKSIQSLKNIISSKYQYNEAIELNIDNNIIKKGIDKDLPKLFGNMIQNQQINDGSMIGMFTLKSLVDEYYICFEIKSQSKINVTLSSNQYCFFDLIFQNLKFLLSSS